MIKKPREQKSSGWGDWLGWSACVGQIDGTVQRRSRECLSETCQGKREETRHCNRYSTNPQTPDADAPIESQWGQWGAYGPSHLAVEVFKLEQDYAMNIALVVPAMDHQLNKDHATRKVVAHGRHGPPGVNVLLPVVIRVIFTEQDSVHAKNVPKDIQVSKPDVRRLFRVTSEGEYAHFSCFEDFR
ncbi:unnamed protein product [Enterobius vermicularis]|uniref:HGTP_anticodon domain-containing protein n=1 Tax=Enterobius vermicularis TaxID=51028 RepID=A0A0N4V639_ENTVE|nr:unnamed protein product [Enterobius vermicularis]